MTVTVILRLPVVLARRARSRSAHYLDIANGLYVPPVAIGSRAVGWPESEVEALAKATVRGDSEDQIRNLVTKLLADRASIE